MSESDGNHGPARPRQVTVAGVMAASGCGLLVLSLFDAMATIRSADMRDRIAQFLSTPPGSGLGLDTASVVDLLRGVVLLSGALAAAGVVLSIFALQRHRGARVGLSVAAGLMLVSATFVSGILPVVVAVAAMMMWGRDARDWFNGRPAQARPGRGSATRDDPSTGPPPPGMAAWQPGSGEPGPDAGPEPGPAAGPPAAAYPYGALPPQLGPPPGYPTGYPTHDGRRLGSRPAQVTVAVVLTWVFSSLVVLGFTMVVLTLLVQRDQLLEEIRKNATLADAGFSSRQILGFLWVLSAVSIFWALAAMALAVLVFRRVGLARVLLLVSAALAGVAGLVAVPVGWVHAVVAFACVVLLSLRSTREWFAGERPPAAPGSPPAGSPGGATYPPPDSGKPPVW